MAGRRRPRTQARPRRLRRRLRVLPSYALAMFGSPVSIGTLIWIVIGLIVASNRGYLGNLDNLSGVLSAVLAVIAWPLVLLGVHVAI